MSNLRIKLALIGLILLTSSIAFGQLTLEDIFLNNKYNVQTGGDVEFLHTEPLMAKLIDTLSGKSIFLFNSKNERVRAIKLSESNTNETNKNWEDIRFSNSDELFLLSCDCERMYRRSSGCKYYIGDKNGKLTALSNDYQYFPDIAFDDKKVAFVQNNNLYYKDLSSGKEIAITQDGKWNFIINGKSDWVYEEELELTKAFSWNRQSNKLAYLKFNEEAVKEYTIPFYHDMQYPNLFSYKYPKVGEQNAIVTAWYYDTKKKKNKPLHIPYTYEYIPRIYWNSTGEEIVLMLLNRHQDTLQIVGYNVKSKSFRKLYTASSNTYVELPKGLYFLSNNSFIIDAEQDGYNHLYYYDKDGQLISQLTKGAYEVTELYGVSEKKKTIYYQCNEENELERSIYSINYETGEKKQLSANTGTNNAVFSSDFFFYIHTYSNITTPPVVSIVNTESGNSTLLEDNQSIKDTLINISKKFFIKIPINENYLNAWIIKPSNFDSTKQYPLLMYVYGGPGNQAVLNEWQRSNQLYFNYLTQQGYIVACVDNRGTGGRGEYFKKMTFLNLGKYETDDQITAATYFSRLPFIDKNRIGIYGASYGGYMASLCLLEGNAVFKSAIAVAPVTDWSLYDNIYTERYMHTPKENPIGYKQFNPIALSNKLTGNLLLIHGTADDNVHFQNSVFFTTALNAANKHYDFIIYPDANHGMGNKKNRYDMYLKMTKFLKEKL